MTPGSALDTVTTGAEMIERSCRGRVDRVLWLHRTDRWYVGDFLRHAAWLQWLRDNFPRASIDLASHPAYLPLYADDRFTGLLDVAGLDAWTIRRYDLVVVPTAFRPASVGDGVPRLLSTWDTGWTLHAHGRLQARGSKHEMNYFRAAHPSAVRGPRHAEPSPLRLSDAERDVVEEALAAAFPDAAPVVVYNPTVSTPFTRGAAAPPKEVDGALSASEHALVITGLLDRLPEHHILVGSALKPRDRVNAGMLQAVTRLVDSGRVRALTSVPLPAATSLRGFAALLAADRVCAVAGAGTGTTTHLASLLPICSFSIERAADGPMRVNWARPEDFQMGSFRWRNPHSAAGIYTLDWSNKTPAALGAAADGFACHHHALAHDIQSPFAHPEAAARPLARFTQAWPHDPAAALQAAQVLLADMTPPDRAHYGHFADEAAYLQLTHATTTTGLAALTEALTTPDPVAAATALHLFEDSNLHKLLTRLARGSTAGPIRAATSSSLRCLGEDRCGPAGDPR